MLLSRQRGLKGELTINEMRWGSEVRGGSPNGLLSHYLGSIMTALYKPFDQYLRRRPPDVRPAQQMPCMFGYLISGAAQADAASSAADCWLQDHRQADLRGSPFYVTRIRGQAISRYGTSAPARS